MNERTNLITKKMRKWTGGRCERQTPGWKFVYTFRFARDFPDSGTPANQKCLHLSICARGKLKILITVAQIASVSVTLIGVSKALGMMVFLEIHIYSTV